MARPLSSRTLLTILVGAPLLGCAAKPPERPIVLRPPSFPERQSLRHAASHHAPASSTKTGPAASPKSVEAATSPTAPAETNEESPAPVLTPDQKETLFDAFDHFLAQTGRTP